MNKTLIFIFLAIIIIVAGFFGFWYYRDTIFSKEILRLEILGPDTAKMGDEISYTVKYKNNGNFVLESPKLIFELPENSLTEDGKTRLTQNLKDIYPGDEQVVTFKARLLGKEGDLKVAHAWLSYIPKNLSARYESDTTFTTKIDTALITLGFDLPSKIEKGKEINYNINYFSNIDYPLENISVKVDAINGFNFESADPVSLDNAEWKLATLNKAQGGRIVIKGFVNADVGTHLNFSAKLGMWVNGTFVVIKEANQDVEIINPLLFLSEQINGSSHYVASSGEILHYQIFIRNIGSSSVDNLFVQSHLDGTAFDLSTLHSSEGSARPNDGLIIWDSKQVPTLQHLAPNQEVHVDFDVNLKNNWAPLDSEKNNVMLKNIVTVADMSQEFDTKINSNLQLSQKAYHADFGGFKNSGPVPPEVGKDTTYTIAWQIKNYLNNVKNVKVRAMLPQGITLTSVLPEEQISNFSLDNASRQIVWSVGDLSAGTGTTSNPPTIYFQITLTPGPMQRGSLVNLISEAIISGEDQSTGNVISTTVPKVNTDLPDDQSNSGGGIVK